MRGAKFSGAKVP